VVRLRYRRIKESRIAKDIIRPPKVLIVLVLYSNP